MNDKAQILEEIDGKIVTRKAMGWRFLATMLLIFAIAWLLLFPKIYLQNAIYYKSREIATLQREYDTLKEENAAIKSRVEAMRFQNQVLDTMFELERK